MIDAAVTVSVISHEQEALLQRLLGDLASVEPRCVGQVVVTHNLETADRSCPAVFDGCCQVVVNPRPKGFGANHNAAFAYCNTDWFAVVNPDIRMQDDVFSRLIEQATLEDAVLAPALVDPHTGQIAPHRGMLTPWEVLRRRLPGWKPADEPLWLPGAFLLFRAEAFRRIGGFDERYFLYAEDFDICARLRLAGGRLHYVPEVQVEHAAQRSSHVRWRYLRWHVGSLLKLWTSRTFWCYRALLRREARAA